MQKFNKGDKVTIKHMSGDTTVRESKHLRVVGAEAFVHSTLEGGGSVFLTIPTHWYYAQQGSYFALTEEVELVEGHTP